MTNAISSALSRRQLLAAASGLVAGTSLSGFQPLLAQRAPLRWGSASIGSTGYVIIEGLASTVSRLTDLKGSSVATSGAVENMALIGRKEIDLGQTTSLEWPLAYKGEGPFKQKIEPVQLLSYAIWSQHPIVRADSGIKKLEDLVGKRVCPGPAAGAAAHLFKVVFTQLGLYDKVRWSFASLRETHDGFKAGAFDAIGTVLLDGRPAPILRELENSVKVRPIVMEKALVQDLEKAHPGILHYTIPTDRWNALEAPLDTAAVSGILGCAPTISDADGYTIVKTIYDNADDIRKISTDLSLIRTDIATRFLLPGFPVNGGAAKYFREKGIWRNELTARG
jgi:uncharacterized protein